MYQFWYAINKNNIMLVVSSRDFRDNQRKYFDLASKQRVIIKRKREFLELVPRGYEIPENPSPSNDPYFDDPRNIESILISSEQANNGEIAITLKSKEDIKKMLGL